MTSKHWKKFYLEHFSNIIRSRNNLEACKWLNQSDNLLGISISFLISLLICFTRKSFFDVSSRLARSNPCLMPWQTQKLKEEENKSSSIFWQSIIIKETKIKWIFIRLWLTKMFFITRWLNRIIFVCWRINFISHELSLYWEGAN